MADGKKSADEDAPVGFQKWRPLLE